ncbi:hypothetical protein BJX99DRAFT_262178 [Aspergillus californicus]
MDFKHSDYIIAWICALPLEMAAAKIMLDLTHPTLPQPETDHNAYLLGSISGRNIAVACLPSGVYGTTSAAIVLAQMLPTFPSLRFALMVGIGGGAPTNRDIRLGDVVVSIPTETSGGVIQYDYGKTLFSGCLHRTGSLNKPPHYILTAISKIRSVSMLEKSAVQLHKIDVLDQYPELHELFSRPSKDWLFKSSYGHQSELPDCSQCDQSQLIPRTLRDHSEPRIHYGLIASGNQVMKDAKTRDDIAKNLDILCFEMEAAGLMDQLPCLVIRGICDYSDSHKNKEWQGYASLTAAAYAKLLLSVIPRNHQPVKGDEFSEEEKDCLQSLFLTDPTEDKSALKRKKGGRVEGTCEWILETDELRYWLRDLEDDDPKASNILWLHGYPGTGKSTIAITITDELPKQYPFVNGDKVLVYFFCDSSMEKQRTAVSVLRGLVYQLIQQRPRLIKYLLPRYLNRKKTLFSSFDALWTIFFELCQASPFQVYCIIDALDECVPDSQQILLRQISQAFTAQGPGHSTVRRPNLLITSRPYPEIDDYLSQFRSRDLATYSALKKDLALMIRDKITDLAARKKYPPRVVDEVSRILEEKAGGTFLWVGIACAELAQPHVRARNTVATLQEMPRDLHLLYEQLLSKALTDSDNVDGSHATILQMLKVVTSALRPLSVPEIAEICQLYPDHDERSRIQFTMDDIALCRLMIIVHDGRVQLLHQSVKDFLVKKRHAVDTEDSHNELADRCISNLLEHLACPGSHGPGGVLLKYSVDCWPDHSRLAGSRFRVGAHHEPFFELQSRTWKQWLEEYNRGDTFMALQEGFCVLHAAARWGINPLMSWALARVATMYPAEKMYDDRMFGTAKGTTPLEEAVNSGYTSTIEIIIGSLRQEIEIPENVSVAAAKNSMSGREIFELLLEQRGDQIQITNEVVKAAASNSKDGKEIIALLLDRQKYRSQISEDLVTSLADHPQHGTEIMALLLGRRGATTQIIESVVSTILSQFDATIARLLLDRQHIQLTGNLLNAVARNGRYGEEITTILLGRQKDRILLTEDMVKAAGHGSRKEIVARLLDTQGDQIQLTEDAVLTVVSRFDAKTMTILLDREGSQVQITEEILEVAARNKNYGKEIIELLLNRQGDHIQVPEKVIKAAAENENSGKEIMTLLVRERGDQIRITEEVVKAVAGNWSSGNEIMRSMLAYRGEEVQITEEVIRTAAGNWINGKEIIALVLDRKGFQIQITEEVTKAAAGNEHTGIEILELLLDRIGDGIKITEEVAKAAASNRKNGEGIMTLLLRRRRDETQITKDIIKAAAGNEESGKQVIKLLLDQQGDHISFSSDVLSSAAFCGNEAVIGLLASKFGHELPTEHRQIAQLYNLAKHGALKRVKQLLAEGVQPDTRNDQGVTPLWNAASYGHFQVVEALLQTNQVDVNAKSSAGRTPIFWAAARGYASIVRLLLDAHAVPNVPDINGNTAYDMARRHAHFEVARILKGTLIPTPEPKTRCGLVCSTQETNHRVLLIEPSSAKWRPSDHPLFAFTGQHTPTTQCENPPEVD